MMQIALVHFNKSNRRYYFSNKNNIELKIDDIVLVETVVGLELGIVTQLKEENDQEILKALNPVINKASNEDLITFEENEALEEDIVSQTASLILKHKLDMEALMAEYTLDRERLVIYFKAQGRIDFRELVKELSRVYQTRIELRQIGPRDIAKMIGGLGPCGRVLCCASFIGDFEPVTINMAKNQELSLNPDNISGVCGRLLCCLKYEDSVYEEMREIMPDLNEVVRTNKGKGKVVDLNFLKSQIKINYFNHDINSEWIDYKTILTK